MPEELSVPKREDDPTFRHMNASLYERLATMWREDRRKGRRMDFHPWYAQFSETAVVEWWLLTPQEREEIQAWISSKTNPRLAALCHNSDASPAGNAVGRPKTSGTHSTGVRKKNFSREALERARELERDPTRIAAILQGES